MTLSTGFAPVTTPNAGRLILGSLPGALSLLRQQYYASRQNRFWWIMGELYGAHPALPYGQRLYMLRRAGLALWDVCHAARRPGSLDAAILASSVVANPLAAFLAGHRHVELICFNGRAAQKLFDIHVLPALPARLAAVRRVSLPSTSPAYAGMRPEEKLARWRDVLAPG